MNGQQTDFEVLARLYIEAARKARRATIKTRTGIAGLVCSHGVGGPVPLLDKI